MARTESVAIGGYFATPEDHLPALAGLIDAEAVIRSSMSFAVCDPCAADGKAIITLMNAWANQSMRELPTHVRGSQKQFLLYACELEAERAAALKSVVNRTFGYDAEHERTIAGDAFRVTWEHEGGRLHQGGCHLLYLNPPYDTDSVYGRLEQRFLARFSAVLLPRHGVLMYVLPAHALAASASYLAQHFQDITCFRFFPETYAVFKQVVLLARRRDEPEDEPDAREVTRIMGWVNDPTTIPELNTQLTPVLALTHSTQKPGLPAWRLAPLDLLSARHAFQPGREKAGGTVRYGLHMGVSDLLGGQVYPLAMPPRPGHIAQALAAGIMNGAVLNPDADHLPRLLAKGVFERELRRVEERTNKQGETTGLVHIQQPSLKLTVLDIDAGRYRDIAPGSVPSGSTDLEQMNVADVLTNYRTSLSTVMERMCPALHPIGVGQSRLPLPRLNRRPYRAQHEAISATLKLLAREEQPFILGEVGTGKSTIALATIAALAQRHRNALMTAMQLQGHDGHTLPIVQRALILCPPHLLQSWQDQVAAVLPGANVQVLMRIADIDRTFPPKPASLPGSGLTISILSRETGKLSHARGGGADVSAAGLGRRICPRCGVYVGSSQDTLAEERRRCDRTRSLPVDTAARAAKQLAELLVPVDGDASKVRSLAGRQRYLLELHVRAQTKRDAMSKEDQDAEKQAAWERRRAGARSRTLDSPVEVLVTQLRQTVQEAYQSGARDRTVSLLRTLGLLHWSMVGMVGWQDQLTDTIDAMWEMSRSDRSDYGCGADVRTLLRELLLLLWSNGPEVTITERLQADKTLDRPTYTLSTSNPWSKHDNAVRWLSQEAERVEAVRDGRMDPSAYRIQEAYGEYPLHFSVSGQLLWMSLPAGSYRAALQALKDLARLGHFTQTEPCGEFLYQAEPHPRRVALATHIARRASHQFDLLVIDEAHEYAGDSAQEMVAHQLSEVGYPTLLLTGSLMNGLASGLFKNLWAMNKRFRAEFDRTAKRAFISRYGYRKILTEPEDDPVAAVAYGAMTNVKTTRDLRAIRSLGEAPGVLPLLLLKHILPTAVTIQKQDLDDALPPQLPPEVILLRPDPAVPSDAQLWTRGRSLLNAIASAIGQDAFTAMSGKLFGALGQAPSYFDRATLDTGNLLTKDGQHRWETRYPEAVGGSLVSAMELFPASVLLPKERAMLSWIGDELEQDRNVIVFVTHSGKEGLMQRLARLIGDHLGEKAAILKDVKTSVREAWINEEVVGKRRRILIANPKSVQTGLNNLVWFASAWWHQFLPDAIIYRQANGRLHRIGQTKPVKLAIPVYQQTPQELMQDLLQRKTAASEQVDGMDVSAALDAAGAGEANAIDTLELGRAIYAMLLQEGRTRFRAAAD